MTVIGILKSLWSIATIPVPLGLALAGMIAVGFVIHDIDTDKCDAAANARKVEGLELQLKVQRETTAEKQRLLEAARQRGDKLAEKVGQYEIDIETNAVCRSPANARKLRELGH